MNKKILNYNKMETIVQNFTHDVKIGHWGWTTLNWFGGLNWNWFGFGIK